MKLHIASAVLSLSLFLGAQAADPAPSAPPTPGTPNLESPEFATADGCWKELQRFREAFSPKPGPREEVLAQMRSWVSTQKQIADVFVRKFPEDDRRWQARMISLRSGLQLRRFDGQPGLTAADQEALSEIINSPDAPAGARGEAAFVSATSLAGRLRPEKPEDYADFHKAAADFFAKFPDHPLTVQMRTVQLQVLRTDPTAEGAKILNSLTDSTDAQLAQAAKSLIAQSHKLAELKSKPMDLKFTAVDGSSIDLADLRGKVVLVDFWASWCGPCIAEMPNVVATYQKLHAKGFEILGISLDQDKSKMEAALKEQKMTWPQYFDGAGWKNRISSSFGIDSIPAAWVLDKKGMLRETSLRGEALGAGVEKLLAE